jgi:hypothetical protein
VKWWLTLFVEDLATKTTCSGSALRLYLMLLSMCLEDADLRVELLHKGSCRVQALGSTAMMINDNTDLFLELEADKLLEILPFEGLHFRINASWAALIYRPEVHTHELSGLAIATSDGMWNPLPAFFEPALRQYPLRIVETAVNICAEKARLGDFYSEANIVSYFWGCCRGMSRKAS